VNVLIVHPIFPGQFGLLAKALTRNGDRVLFLAHAGRRESRGVALELYSLTNRAEPGAHPHLVSPEQAILHAEGAMHHGLTLKASGFIPDVIIGHAGFGQLALMREVFPAASIIAYAEYFYRSYGADVGFDSELALSATDFPRVRLKNAPTLLSLDAADAAYTPTLWQRDLFPCAYRQNIAIIHDGIDTAQFQKRRRKSLTLPSGRQIGSDVPLITYAARSLEYYRGFHKFWPALSNVLRRRPDAHAVVVGARRPAYGPAGETDLVERMMAEYPVDLNRVFMADALSRAEYIEMLQASWCHVYLSYPFVPSWSLVEAMASGAPLIASDVAPIREIVGEGTCHLVDFFDQDGLVNAMIETLSDRTGARRRARRARARAVAEFDFNQKSWPHLRQLINNALERC